MTPRTITVQGGDPGLFVLGALMGAGVMYLFDPDRGRRRRARLRDRLLHGAHEAEDFGEAAASTARHMRNRARGMLAETGYVDPERVGIWGSSYGGLMTLMSLFNKPGVYAAGIAGAPATNVSHAFPSQQWVMGEPRGDDYPERYRRQSALYHHAGLQDPLMIIHGTNDPVVLYSDTIALAERLVADGKQFELVTLPGGSHSWDTDSMEQTRFAFKKMAAFFDRHLK